MDLPLNDSRPKLELEYLAALMAFREGAVSSEELSGAVTDLVEGGALSLLDALRDRAGLTVEQVREVRERAGLCAELVAARLRYERAKSQSQHMSAGPAIYFDDEEAQQFRASSKHERNNQPLSMPESNQHALIEQDAHGAGFIEHKTANENVSPQQSETQKANRIAWVDPHDMELDGLDHGVPDVDEMPEEDFEWRPTSEVLSHVYMLEDTLRAFSGGMLGIVSTLGLMLCLGLGITGVVYYSETIANWMNGTAYTSSASNAVNTLEQKPGETSKAEANDVEATDEMFQVTEASNDEPSIAASDVLVSEEQKPAAEDSNGDSTVQPVVDESNPAVVEPVIDAAALQAAREEALIKIEDQMRLANQDLGRSDLDSALGRVKLLHELRQSSLDLSIDSRWLILGTTLLLTKNAESATNEAMAWVRPLLEADEPQARLVCGAWIVKASPAQLDELERLVTAEGAERVSPEVINWLFAARGKRDDVVDALRAKLQGQNDSDPLNHFFLSLALFNAGQRDPSLRSLQQFAPLIKTPTYWLGSSPQPEWTWANAVLVRLFREQGNALQKKLEIPRSN